MRKQQQFYWLLSLYAAVVYYGLVTAVREGDALRAFAYVWLASPAIMVVLAVLWEAMPGDKTGVVRLRQLVDIRRGSWAFLFGDTIALPAAAAFAALSWQSMPRYGWGSSVWWLVVSAVVGIVAGLAFRAADKGGYVKAGMASALRSPTKEAHDRFAAYPVLAGGTVCFGAPLLAVFDPYVYAMVGCLLVWLVLCVADMRRGLDPRDLHPCWDPVKFVPVPTPSK